MRKMGPVPQPALCYKIIPTKCCFNDTSYLLYVWRVAVKG